MRFQEIWGMVRKFFENFKKIWLRLKGKDPDLLAKIEGFGGETQRKLELIQELQNELTSFRIENTQLKAQTKETEFLRQAVENIEKQRVGLVRQIENLKRELRDDREVFEKLKQLFIQFLVAEESAPWVNKGHCRDEFISACREVIPIGEKEREEILKIAEEIKSEKRRISLRELLTRLKKNPENTNP